MADIRGEDSLQLFVWRLRLVRSLLAGVIEGGGRLLHPNTDDSYEIDVTFGGVGNQLSWRGKKIARHLLRLACLLTLLADTPGFADWYATVSGRSNDA